MIGADVLEHCPLKFPRATERRTIHVISLRKNAWWLSVDDVPWLLLLTRLRDELELSGVPLVVDDDSQGSATAARESDSSAQTADSQGSAGSGGDSESLEPNAGRPTENPIEQWQRSTTLLSRFGSSSATPSCSEASTPGRRARPQGRLSERGPRPSATAAERERGFLMHTCIKL